MKTKIIALITIVPVLFLSSCNYLDKLPDGDMTLEDAFSNYILADRFFANAHTHLPNETQIPCTVSETANRSPYTGGCDEMEITFGAAFSHMINSGAWNASNVVPIWQESYRGIRKVNFYLENLDKVPVSGKEFTEVDRERRRGEAYFLRAMYKFLLLRCYGPFVILDNSLATDLNISSYKRATYSDCVQCIIDDCKLAEELLPLQYDFSLEGGKYGRATAAAALALKSRTLLYAASPLFNGNPDYADFADQDGLLLFPTQENLSLWSDAADAALDAITKLEGAGYGIYEKHADPMENFFQIFHDQFNSEWIYWRNIGTDVHGLDRCANPLSVSGFSILSVTQEMIDAYHMENGEVPVTGYNADGSPIINPASGYVEEGYASAASAKGYYPVGVRNMYVGREPRFYACINFAGRPWKTTDCSLWNEGRDGKRNAGSDYCKTGYLLRKYANPGLRFSDYQGLYWNHAHYFRFSELYLNYAEAINEAEGPDKAYRYLNRIRTRAGLDAFAEGSLTQGQMREKIRHERRIELAFENHRFFDVRRWKTAPQTESKPIYGLNIFAGSHLQDDAFYVRTLVEPRTFEKQHYLFPIPQDEINRSERVLEQNPWW